MSLKLNALQDLVEGPEIKPRKENDVVSKRSLLSEKPTESKKTPVGIVELDESLGGGFPARSLILLTGNAGSGKTILSTQFLYNGAVKCGEKGVYVSFAENREDFYRNMLSLGMDMRSLERKGLFKFMDMVTMGGVEALTVITEEIVKTVSALKAKRLVIDSLSAFLQNMGVAETRIFLHTVLSKITKNLDITTIVLGEIPYGETKTGLGVEEFVVDGVILLTHMDQTSSANRKLTIAKMRGTPLDRTSFEYLIDKKCGGIGPIVFPERANILVSPTDRISTGIEELDKMLHGGVFRGSVTLIEGVSGVGKTIACLQFLVANALKGEKALFISLEEPTGQIMRTLKNLGHNLKTLDDKLAIGSYVPEALTPLQYYKLLKDMLDKHEPTVIVFDPISAMQHLITEKDFINFVRYLQLLSKNKVITVFLTSTIGSSESLESTAISLLTDNIIRMRYLESQEKMGRQLIIVKTRGSGHDNKIVDFEIIDGKGIEIKTDMALAKECLT